MALGLRLDFLSVSETLSTGSELPAAAFPSSCGLASRAPGPPDEAGAATGVAALFCTGLTAFERPVPEVAGVVDADGATAGGTEAGAEGVGELLVLLLLLLCGGAELVVVVAVVVAGAAATVAAEGPVVGEGVVFLLSSAGAVSTAGLVNASRKSCPKRFRSEFWSSLVLPVKRKD